MSHHVLLGNLNALSKVANLFNLLWRNAACSCCGHWATDEFLSVECFHPAVAVVGRRKRDRTLHENAAGVAKAKGKRDTSVTDEQRRAVSISLLLQAKTALEYNKDARLNALWLMQYALGSRRATARELTWTDLRFRAFAGMFADAQREVPLLCTYFEATKTYEGFVHCIGALPHVDPWVCPAGAMADALVEFCHRPGGDATTPPVDFAPAFTRNDGELVASGVKPIHFREAGTAVGFRSWYRMLAFPSPRGGLLKPMTYQYHSTSLRLRLMAAGVPDWAAKTQLGRRAAAQAGKERGASEADNKDHLMWSVGPGSGTYEAAIFTPTIVNALSGRYVDCKSSTTPLLSVPVPEELQNSIFPWLKKAEEALSERVAADPSAQDEALRDLFAFVRRFRCVCFQTHTARLATASVPSHAYVLRQPLLSKSAFQNYRTLVARTLETAGETAAAAVAQVIPPLAEAFRVAVEAVATASAAGTRGVERRLSEQMDAGAAVVKAHEEIAVERVVASTTAAATQVNGYVDNRFNALEAELSRMREVLARLIMDDVLQTPRARQLVREELSRAPAPPPHGSAAACVLLSESQRAVLPAPPPPVRVSQRFLEDRNRVRSLQAAERLAGVPIHASADECIPLLPMARQLNWRMALDEYAVGLDERLSIREM